MTDIQIKDKLSLEGATVTSKKRKVYSYGYSMTSKWSVVLSDPVFGKVWFKTEVQFSDDLEVGDTLDAIVTVTGFGEDIIFTNRPTKAYVHKQPEAHSVDNFDDHKPEVLAF